MQRGPDDIPVPQNIQWLVKLVGEEAALRLVEVHGGTRVYVPKGRLARSELVRSTGLPAKTLDPLAKERGGELLLLPLCREWRVRLYRHRDGAGYAAIARKLGITESAVFKCLHNSGMTGQMELSL